VLIDYTSFLSLHSSNNSIVKWWAKRWMSMDVDTNFTIKM